MKNYINQFLVIGLIALAGTFAINAVSLNYDEIKSGYKIGDKVKDFNLKNVDNSMVSLKGLQNAKGAIVIFSCNHCPWVIKYEDRMKAIDKKYKKLGFPVVAINSNSVEKQPDDSFDKMQERAKKKKFSFAYVIDETQDVAKQFGATRTPHIYLLEKKNDNDWFVRYIGAIDDNADDAKAVKKKYLENAIDALLSNQPVPEAETKAIGCTIKWK